jgi:hypothetical protein
VPARDRPATRHRHRIAIVAAALIAALFLTHAIYWHLPYRPDGFADEAVILAIAAALGAMFGVVARRIHSGFVSFGLWPSACVLALIAYFGLRVWDPLARERSWLYAPANCEFAVDFPRRASVVSARVPATGGVGQRVERAILAEVGLALTLSAECAGHAAPLDEGSREALAAAAESGLRQSAERAGLTILAFSREARGLIVLRAVDVSGRDSRNRPILRQAEGRALLGERSVLVLWSWAIAPDAASVPDQARRFFASARSRPSP